MLIENGVSVSSKILKVKGVSVKWNPPDMPVVRYPNEIQMVWAVPTIANVQSGK